MIEALLRQTSPGFSAQARLGAASFVHRLGSSLSRHTHYHSGILDGVFERLDEGRVGSDRVQFRPARALTPHDVTAIAEQVRRRVLCWFARSGLLDADDARDILAWNNRGFSLNAAVPIINHDPRNGS